jgi:hypothetical protein
MLSQEERKKEESKSEDQQIKEQKEISMPKQVKEEVFSLNFIPSQAQTEKEVKPFFQRTIIPLLSGILPWLNPFFSFLAR